MKKAQRQGKRIGRKPSRRSASKRPLKRAKGTKSKAGKSTTPKASKALTLRRSLAAKKGWKKRKRSEAARKGWETRRSNLRRKKKLRVVGKPPAPPRRPKTLPAGSELELSARARTDGTGKMTRSRLLYLKIRVVLLRPMTKEEAIRKLNLTVWSGVVQAGIELAWINWKKGEGYHRASGTYIDAKAQRALVDFAGAIMSSPQRRIAVVAPRDL